MRELAWYILFTHVLNLLKMWELWIFYMSGLVAASQVSPVSTGPLFPSCMACFVSPFSAIAWVTLGPKAHSPCCNGI